MTEEIKNIEFVAACIEGDKLYGAGIGVNILFKYVKFLSMKESYIVSLVTRMKLQCIVWKRIHLRIIDRRVKRMKRFLSDVYVV